MSNNAKIAEDLDDEEFSESKLFDPSTNLRLEATGNLLYHIHSTFFAGLLCRSETTSLQFYEHVVIATLTSQLWCFPKRVIVECIPRFKIVDAKFSLGPRAIPTSAWILIFLGIILAIVGGTKGGCQGCSDDDWYYCTSTSGTCAMLVIGILLLLIPIPVYVLLHFIRKRHYIFLDVKTSPRYVCCNGVIKPRDYCFKKIGFDHATDKKAAFDQYYLIEYVYGSLAQAGNVVTNEAHLLNHFNHAALCTPIVPIHSDNTDGSGVVPSPLQRRNNRSSVIKSLDI